MGIGAVLGGAGIASSLIGAAGSSSAASSQANAAQNATNTQLGMFNQVMGNLQPYMGAGQGALGALEFGLGLNPSYGAAPAGNAAGIPMGGSLALYQQAGGGSIGVSPGAYNFAPPTDSVSLLTGQSPGGQYYTPPNTGQAQIAPTGGTQAFRTAGTGAPTAGPEGLTSGQFLHQFNASDLTSNLAPNYQFQLGQGQGQIANEGAATGMSGNALQGLQSFAQDYAGNAYQQAFQNYTTNQQNIYGRLGNLAQLGQASSTGSASGAPLFSSGISQTIQGLGQAQAAGTVGVANALSGGIGNLGSSYLLSNLLANQGGVPLTGGGTGFNI